MDAFQTSDWIVSIIRSSNLNFSLTETPFSVSVVLKKSFTKKKYGSVRSSLIKMNADSTLSKEPQQNGRHLPQHITEGLPDVPIPLLNHKHHLVHKESSILNNATLKNLKSNPDMLVAVKPSQQNHPPHPHAEELLDPNLQHKVVHLHRQALAPYQPEYGQQILQPLPHVEST